MYYDEFIYCTTTSNLYSKHLAILYHVIHDTMFSETVERGVQGKCGHHASRCHLSGTVLNQSAAQAAGADRLSNPFEIHHFTSL